MQQPSSPGQFAQPAKFSSQPGLLALAVGDVNSDGHTEIVTAGSKGILLHLQDPSHLGVFLAPEVIAAP